MINKFVNRFKTDEKFAYGFVFAIITIIQTFRYISGYTEWADLAYPLSDNDRYISSIFCMLMTFCYDTYKYGLISRGLLNSIFYVIYLGLDKAVFGIAGIHVDYIMYFVVAKCIFVVILNIFMLILIRKIMHILKDRIGNKCYYLIPFLLMIRTLFYMAFEYNYNDYVLFVLQIWAVYYVLKDKEFCAVIPMVISIFIHEGSALLTCPVVFMFIVFKHMRDNVQDKVKSYIKMVVMCLIVCVPVLYFLKFQSYFHPEGLTETVLKDMMVALDLDPEGPLYAKILPEMVFLDQFIYTKNTTGWSVFGINASDFYVGIFLSWLCTLFYYIMLLPFIIPVFRAFVKNVRAEKNVFVKLEKTAITFMGFICIIPFIVYKEDISRWILFMWLYYGLMAFYGLYTGNGIMISVMDDFKDKFVKTMNRSKIDVIFILIYLGLLTPFGCGYINLFFGMFYFALGRFINSNFDGFLMSVDAFLRNANQLR